MDNSPFSKLSAELRNMIYEYALKQERPIIVTAYSTAKHTEHEHHTADRHPLALAQTCQEIRGESLQLFYAVNTFTLSFRLAKSQTQVRRQLERFRSAIGLSNANAIGSMVLKLDAADIGEDDTMVESLNKIFDFLVQVVNECISKAWTCNFVTKAPIIDSVSAPEVPQGLVFEVGFGSLGSSFEDNVEAVTKTSIKDNRVLVLKAAYIFKKILDALQDYVNAETQALDEILD